MLAKDRNGYSPMLAQMNPIIRKKPEKSAIRPTDPYGECAVLSSKLPSSRPKMTAQPIQSAPKSTLLFGPVTKRFTHEVSRCSWLMAAFWKMYTNPPPMASEMKNSIGFVNGSVKSVMRKS